MRLMVNSKIIKHNPGVSRRTKKEENQRVSRRRRNPVHAFKRELKNRNHNSVPAGYVDHT